MAAVTKHSPSAEVPTGGSFLLREVGAYPVMTPEGFSEEQRLFFQTALAFTRDQVLPKAEHLEKKDNAMLRALLVEAGALGLCSVDIPEAYGGLGLDKTTSMLLAEASTTYGAWSVTLGAHTGIGSQPIVWFGTPEQKQRYLPRAATAEWVAAYALTETGSGSDALGAKTKAMLSADKTHYVFNGAKQFITNAAFADFFIVFAKVEGEKFTAFIVDRKTPGLSIGAEEHKMGIRGSSTCSVIFEDARVPVGQVLGEIGKGHKIAFNILNLGRLKLGAGVVGAMKASLQYSVAYGADRKQFGTALIKFGLIREKLARMATWIYAVETMAYRTSGMIDDRLSAEDRTAADYDAKTISAIEEFAIEASIAKVFGSECLSSVVDEAVQIHGGYGYVEEFPVERAYRDQRINRIFEGTNEINRMLITGMLLKRAVKGQLPLFDFAQSVDEELTQKVASRPRTSDALAQESMTAEHLKRLAVYALKVAAEKFGPEIEQHQQILAAVSDIVIDAYALDSILCRSRQVPEGAALDSVQVAMVSQFATDAHARGYANAKKAICACAQGPELLAHLGKIALLYFDALHDPTALTETIASAVESRGGYPLGR